MKLAQFVKSVSVQSNIEIRKVDDDGETIDTLFFNQCEGLRESDLNGWKSLTIKYVYSETFQRKYWNHSETSALLVIEVA